MVSVLATRLRANHYVTKTIGLGIGYSKVIQSGFYHHQKLETATDDEDVIKKVCFLLFDRYYEDLPIRKVSICCGDLENKLGMQLNLFEDYENALKKENFNKAIDEVKEKYGKNSLLKASSLLEDSTAKERNKKIGGHHE